MFSVVVIYQVLPSKTFCYSNSTMVNFRKRFDFLLNHAAVQQLHHLLVLHLIPAPHLIH